MKRILIIDDDASVRETFLAALADRNYALETADSGAAGLESARCRRPDLVFLDLKMPEMSGVEALARLHAISPDVPVYIFTGFYRSFLEPLKDLQKRGITFDLARKPLTLAEIRAIADGVLKHSIDTAPPYRPTRGSR
ncbi:MAG: response regulator [Proteobacteria bacterium]|nr:response regulator [Pseudomonadota bacterium]